MAKRAKDQAIASTKYTPAKRSRLSLDEALIAVLIAAMDANQHISREEAWRAHHIIWSMRRFRRRTGEKVDRLIGTVRDRMERDGKAEVLQLAARVLPARLRPTAFAVAVDLMLADTRLESAETRFVKQLAGQLKIPSAVADDIVRAMLIKNSV